MSWVKPNFLWMMYRSGWGTKVDQEVTLALRVDRRAFDAMLSEAVASSFGAALRRVHEGGTIDRYRLGARAHRDSFRQLRATSGSVSDQVSTSTPNAIRRLQAQRPDAIALRVRPSTIVTMGNSSLLNAIGTMAAAAAVVWLLVHHNDERPAPTGVITATPAPSAAPDEHPAFARVALDRCGISVELPVGAIANEERPGVVQAQAADGRKIAVSVICASPRPPGGAAAAVKGFRDALAKGDEVISDTETAIPGVSGAWERKLRLAAGEFQRDVVIVADARTIVSVERMARPTDLADAQRRTAESIANSIVRLEVARGAPSVIAGNGVDPDLGNVPPSYAAPIPNYGAPSYGGDDHAKPVHVNGYTRRDGTYVAPYDRAAPGGGSRHR